MEKYRTSLGAVNRTYMPFNKLVKCNRARYRQHFGIATVGFNGFPPLQGKQYKDVLYCMSAVLY